MSGVNENLQPASGQYKGCDPVGQDHREAFAQPGIGRVASEKLFGGLRKLEIVHGGVIYLLRVTSNGKLILTK